MLLVKFMKNTYERVHFLVKLQVFSRQRYQIKSPLTDIFQLFHLVLRNTYLQEYF